MAWQTYLNNGLHVLMWPVALPHGTIIKSYFLIHFHITKLSLYYSYSELFMTNFSLALPTQWYNTIKEIASNGTPTAFSNTVPRKVTSSRYMKPKPSTLCVQRSFEMYGQFLNHLFAQRKRVIQCNKYISRILLVFYSFS